MSMKKLFFLFAFLVGLGISNSVYAQLVKEVTLTSANTLASELGADVGKVTVLKVSGPLGADDFKTMKEQMTMLKVLDMSGVTELPMTKHWNGNVEEELQSIPREAFQNKLTLQKVVFPGVLQQIDDYAFNGCSNLTEVDFSQATQLKQIRDRAFLECSGLKELDLSACVALEEILGSAFNQCSNLQTVDLSGCTKLTGIGGNYDGSVFSNCSSLRTVDLSGCSALTVIAGSSFSFCENLTSVVLDGCTALNSIGESAFAYCRQLSGFDFSRLTALKEIYSGAFNNCALAGDIVFASGISQIGESAFEQNNEITSFDFSNSTELTVVSSGTFRYCGNLKKVDFSDCSKLGTLNIEAFLECPALEEVVIDNGFYTSIDGVLFVVDKASLLLYPAGKKELAYVIPSTVKTLGEGSFPSNESLKELTIPESVQTIKGNTFSGFMGNRMKVIMQSATPIGLSQSIGLQDAFVYVPKGSAEAYRKASVWSESKIVEIDADPVAVVLEAAGTLGTNLAEQNIPVATILELNINGPMNASDFEIIKQMELLQKVDLSSTVMEDNILPGGAFYQDRNGNIITLSYLEEVVLPNTIKEIGWAAFRSLPALKKVNIPESVERIGNSSFSGCSCLQKIDLSSLSHLIEISNNAFSSSSCVPISLKLPDGLEAIGSFAFSNTGVTSVDFSNTSLYNISDNAFGECPITGALSFPGTLRSVGHSAFASAKVSSIKLKSPDIVYLSENAFESVDKTTCKVYVPKGLNETYKADKYWSAFKNIEEFGYLVTTSYKGNGRVEGAGAYETGETVTLKAIAYGGDVYEVGCFDGWYENNKKISIDPEFTFVMGETDRFLEARFYSEVMAFRGEGNLINDENKVDGSAVLLYNGSLTVEGNEVWKPKSFAYYRDASLLVNSDIQTEAISFNWDAWSGYWHFVSFPYDLKMSEIKLTSSDARFVVREYDGKSRADKGVGESWRQLSDSETLKANTGYIIQFNSGDGMADGFTTKTGDMKALFNRVSVTIPLNTYASDNAMNANWNFVGNPYPAYYSVERLFAEGLDATVTVWSPDLNNYEYYTQDDKDVYLAPLTAFFVQKKTSNLVFNPEGRVAALPRETQAASALRSVDNRQVVNLLLAGEKASDRTRVVFNEEASMEYEIGLDAAKFSSPNADAVAFYSLDKGGNRLAINERPVADGVVRLGCVLPAKGSYTISLKEKIGGGIQLVDKQTGAVCDLNKEAYTFEAEAVTLSDRFELRSDVVTSVEAIDASVRWNVREGLLIVSGLRDVETLSVCDAAGRIHFTGKAMDGEVRIALPQSGIYYMTWTTKAGERQTRSIKW